MSASRWRHPLNTIVDRPRREAALAVAAAWFAFMAGLLAGGDADPASVAFAGAIGAAVVFVGFAAASARMRGWSFVTVRRT